MHSNSDNTDIGDQDNTTPRELHNPVYDGNLTPQPQTNTASQFQLAHTPNNNAAAHDNVAPGPTNVVYDVARVMTADQATYDVVNVPAGGNYSVLNRNGGMDPNPSEYNVLVHDGDNSNQPPIQFQTDEYSKFEA